MMPTTNSKLSNSFPSTIIQLQTPPTSPYSSRLSSPIPSSPPDLMFKSKTIKSPKVVAVSSDSSDESSPTRGRRILNCDSCRQRKSRVSSDLIN